MKKLVLVILNCYLKPNYILGRNMEDIEFKVPINFCALEKVYFGSEVSTYFLDNHKVTNDKIIFFKTQCLNFYVELVSQIYQRFDFRNSNIKILGFISPDSVIKKRLPSITTLCVEFPHLINKSDYQKSDNEWRELRNFDFKEEFLTDNLENIDVEHFWCSILKKKRVDNTFVFPFLQKLILGLLSLPISSANVERTFSTINLNKTKTRNRLDFNTLSGILFTKDYMRRNDICCYNFKYTNEMYNKFNVTMYSTN